MLTLRFGIEDLAQPLSGTGKSFRFGASDLEVFSSHLIMASVRESETLTEIWAGEDTDPFASNDRARVKADAYRSFAEFDGVKIFLRKSAGETLLEVARTATGSSPIYIAKSRNRIVISWKFEEAVGVLPRPTPNKEMCKIYLEYGPSHVRETVINDICHLWPGESATFDGTDLAFRMIDSPEIVLSGTLLDTARATDEFIRICADAMKMQLGRASNILAEVSGGYDSTCSVIAARTIRPDLNSYAVIHDGAVGLQQRRRRGELTSLLNLNDFEAPSFDHPPFAALAVSECRITPYDDMYRLPCVSAVDRHPAKGIDLVLTGIGGDELTMENTFRRQEWELRGRVSKSSTVGSIGRADMFMRRGIWPVHPLTHPRVVNFCRALPRKMRSNRMLNILIMARAGLSDGFIFPRLHENYGNVVLREATTLDFDLLLSNSIILDYGIKDNSKLLERSRQANRDGFGYDLITHLYLLAKLEAVLKSYVK